MAPQQLVCGAARTGWQMDFPVLGPEWSLGGGPSYGPDVNPYAFIDSGGAYGHSLSRKLFFALIEEVRRQFREIPGLREGVEGVHPDSARCVAISTGASLKEMIIPGSLAGVVPLVLGFISVDVLGGFLAGALVTGFCLAIFMANAGGAWDNAKKYIEAGHHGGKGSDCHKAAVVGDTVGDPFKDTSGPAMNILIKVMTIVSLVFASAFVG